MDSDRVDPERAGAPSPNGENGVGGLVRYKQRHYDRGLEDFDRAIRLDPSLDRKPR
jgi:hypothetical protein